MLTKIISGGQTGADQAALNFAIKHDIPRGGWICLRENSSNGFKQTTL